MRFPSPADCSRYVEAEVARAIGGLKGWRVVYSSDESDTRQEKASPCLTWKLDRVSDQSWYLLESREETQEFLIWYGNHQVGAQGLHWIMRPAVHISFDDLWPRNDPLPFKFGLADVLSVMIRSLEYDRPSFPLNTFSLT